MNVTANIPTASILKAAKVIKKMAYAIAGIGTVASYGTQVTLLLAHEVGNFSYIIPATIDMLAICAAMALQLPGLDLVSRRIAGSVLTVAVVVSVLANVLGAENGIAAVAHAWPVVAYLLGELIANRVRAYADRLQAAEDTIPVVAAVSAPVKIASPLPRAARNNHVARKTSHATCGHAATAKDRAVCRTTR